MKSLRPASQDGTFTIQFAVMLAALLSMVGLALDVSRVYARQGEMRGIAESAALAAAHELDGTPAGVDDAVERAADIINTTGMLSADGSIEQNGALEFGATPDGPWTTPYAAADLPAAELGLLRFARVDTALLDGAVTEVDRFFAPGADATSVTFGESAVAGQTLLPIAPLAICAKTNVPAAARPVSGTGPAMLELVEYGFRRGISYNLLADKHYVVNPVEFPADGHSSQDKNFEPDVVRPFVCSGTIMHPDSNKLYVKESFPLEMIPELNSRFKLPSSCHAKVGLPDKNIMEYTDAAWLNNTPLVPYADAAAVESLAPAGTGPARTRDKWGTIWAYARPVQYSAIAPGNAGLPFSETVVPRLYPVDPPETTVLDVVNWPDSRAPAYVARRLGSSTLPTGPSVLWRRIINVPLLECPVSGRVATVLAIGKFAMTSRAVGGATPYIAGEFGGILTDPRPLMTRLYR